MVFIGIDPGLSGAFAALNEDGELLALHDVPTLVVKRKGGKNRTMYNLGSMSSLLQDLTSNETKLLAYLEDVASSPQQGVVSAFTFGRGLGTWEGLLAGLDIPFELIRPQAWKGQAMHGMGTEKDASRVKALRLYPKASLHRKKDHNRADALLMAWCAWQNTPQAGRSTARTAKKTPSGKR